MVKQFSFAELEYQSKKHLTRREVFLNEMEAVMPWSLLLSVVEAHYPRSGKASHPPKKLSSSQRKRNRKQSSRAGQEQFTDEYVMGLANIYMLRRELVS